jgi:hypothetical protein
MRERNSDGIGCELETLQSLEQLNVTSISLSENRRLAERGNEDIVVISPSAKLKLGRLSGPRVVPGVEGISGRKITMRWIRSIWDARFSQ